MRLRTSSANLQTGFKIRATQAHGWVPQSALITTLFVPTGFGASSSDRVAPQVDYIYSWSLTEVWTLTGSTGAVLGRHGDEGTDEWFQSVVIGQEWSDRLSTYGEWYVIRDEQRPGQLGAANHGCRRSVAPLAERAVRLARGRASTTTPTISLPASVSRFGTSGRRPELHTAPTGGPNLPKTAGNLAPRTRWGRAVFAVALFFWDNGAAAASYL